MNKKKNSAWFELGHLLLKLLSLFVGAMWAGYVIADLWGLFVVPLGVVSLSLWHAVGIDVLATFIIAPNNNINERIEEDGYWPVTVAWFFARPGAAFAIGNVAHYMMGG
jgi:hypothetical protein